MSTDKYTFDLERAKAGDPIEYYCIVATEWVPAHFVGVDSKGNVAIEIKASLYSAVFKELRMARKTQTVYVNFRKIPKDYNYSDGIASYYPDKETATQDANEYKADYIAVAVPVEIEV